MEQTVSIVQVVLSLLLVIGLIGLSACALRYLTNKNWLRAMQPNGELKIIDRLMIDARTRLIVAEWRKRDYLILVHPDGAQILDVEEDKPDV